MFTVSSPYLGTFPYKIRSVVFWSISWPSLWSTTKPQASFTNVPSFGLLAFALPASTIQIYIVKNGFLQIGKKIFGTFQTFDPCFCFFWWIGWLMIDAMIFGLLLKMICWFFGEGFCLPSISKSFGVEKGGVHVALGYSDELCGATVFENTWSTGTCSLSPAALLVPWW